MESPDVSTGLHGSGFGGNKYERKAEVAVATKGRKKILVQCPHCGTRYNFKAIKSLFGRAGRAIQLTPDGQEPSIAATCCEKQLTVDEVLTMWGRAKSARRTTFGAGSGRPKDPNRCPCGIMTAARAAKRNHICQAPNNVVRKRKP